MNPAQIEPYKPIVRRGISQLEGRGSLATLDFSWNRLGEMGSSALGEALRLNTKISRIDISHCGITSIAAAALAKGLASDGPAAQAGALRILRADCNPMGDSGREAVVQAAQRRTMLKYSVRTGSSFTDPQQLLASSQVLDDVSQVPGRCRLHCRICSATDVYRHPKALNSLNDSKRMLLRLKAYEFNALLS